MFFKRRYLRFSRFSDKFLYLFNIFFSFSNFYFEFLGSFGYCKIFLNYFIYEKKNRFLKIFSVSNFRIFHGCFYSLMFNLIKGLIFFYERKILIFGLGYKVFLKGRYLHFYLCYSHPVLFKIPPDITIEVKSNEIIIFSINKQRVGEISLFLKNFKKPDPYKGKGLRYSDEKILLKLIKKK